MREITLLRLCTLLARARGDNAAYRDLVSRYHAMAKSLGFEGHIAWAQAMIESGEQSVNIAPTAIALSATLRLGTAAGVI
jgi:hypothetical protein